MYRENWTTEKDELTAKIKNILQWKRTGKVGEVEILVKLKSLKNQIKTATQVGKPDRVGQIERIAQLGKLAELTCWNNWKS